MEWGGDGGWGRCYNFVSFNIYQKIFFNFTKNEVSIETNVANMQCAFIPWNEKKNVNKMYAILDNRTYFAFPIFPMRDIYMHILCVMSSTW